MIKHILQFLRRDRLAMFGVVVIGLLILASLWPVGWLPASPHQTDPSVRLTPPVLIGGTWAHPLGTDNLGRDLFSRSIAGARTSVIIALAAVMISGVLGVGLGLI